ncbi:hypothetical protein GA565_12070 [Rouxiella sp. S1S-2]|uniref:biotin/lipoyl-containing protein n=1 Tax=Rouxiella sp. S1S-2 TaxID=2653856 RepID=UPI001264AEFD|nr:biotin/lipoyl-containing protein [Rouxiella sp. S1S-2]KAB7896654.1 hypothetical protein GA565_12070 [Rouxiella sp. S1S-2]
MLAINEIRKIAQKMQASGLGKIEISGKNFSLRLHCANKDELFTAPRTKQGLDIKAIQQGRFWNRHPLQQKAAIEQGNKVNAGDCLGFLQTGDLLLPIRSPRDGEIICLAVNNGDRVGRGRKLYTLLPSDDQ